MFFVDVRRSTAAAQPFCQFLPCFFTANVRGGFTLKTDQLRAVLRQNVVDIACTTETWLTQSVPSELVSIPGYVTGRTGDLAAGLLCSCVTVYRVSGCLR